jgi:hypothetical protein
MPKLLKAVPLAEHEYGTCMMVLRVSSDVLREVFSVTPTMADGHTAWPARSPDLNPPDVYLLTNYKQLSGCLSDYLHLPCYERMRLFIKLIEGCIEFHRAHFVHFL